MFEFLCFMQTPHKLKAQSFCVRAHYLCLLLHIASHPPRPRIVSISYNSNFPIAASVTMPPRSADAADTTWNRFDLYWGTSAGSVRLMAAETGYSVVHFVGTHSIVLVRTDILGQDCPPPYAQFSNRVRRRDTCVLDPSRAGKWVEYSSAAASALVRGTSVELQAERSLAQEAAHKQLLLMMGYERGSASSMACLGLM